MKKIASLQVIRGLAAIFVVIVHSIDSTYAMNYSYIGNFAFFQNFGAIGVDIFFVISGCIISLIVLSSNTSALDFITRRLIRLMPVYWMATLCCMIISKLKLWESFTTIQCIQSFLILPINKALYKAGHVIYLGWSLSFEMLFYLIFTIALLFCRGKFAIKIVSLTLILSVTAALIFSQYANSFPVSFIGNPIVLEFVLGCICAIIYYNTSFFLNPLYIKIIGAVAICYFLTTIFINNEKFCEASYVIQNAVGFMRVFYWGLPSATLVLAFLLFENIKLFRVKSIFVKVGNASFSLYLTHLFSIALLNKFWRYFAFANADIFILIAVLFSIMVSLLIFKYFENPLINFILIRTKLKKNIG